MAKKKAKKQATELRDGEGRPRAAVAMRPAICPNCNSANRKPFKDGIDRFIDYPVIKFLPGDGFRYDRIVWRKSECIDCGQKLTVREYTMKPETPD